MEKRKCIIKKITLLIFAGALMLSGCGKSGAQVSESENQTEHTAVAETETQGMEAETPPSQDLLSSQEPPAVTVDVCRGEKYAEDGTPLVSGYYEAPNLTGNTAKENYEALRTAMANWASDRDTLFWETMDQYEEYAQDQLTAMGAESFIAYSTDMKLEYTRVDSAIVSFREWYRDYTGGVHGNYGYSGVTFDAVSGELLTLADLMTNEAAMEKFCEIAADYCVENVQEQDLVNLSDNYEAVIRAKFSPGHETDNWYLDAAGITIVCNPYEIGPYAMGPVFITLPYEDIRELLKPQYQILPESGTAMLTPGVEALLPLSGQDKTVPVKLTLIKAQEEEMFPTLAITAGELTTELEALEYVDCAHVIRRANGRMFLLFDIDIASDDYVTLMYELMPEELRMTAELYESSIDQGNVNVDSLKLIQRIDILGSYSVEADYRIETDGALTLESDWFGIVSNSYQPTITAVREVPVVIDGEDALLPVGSRLQLLGTDKVGIIRFRELNSGTEGEIHFNRNEEKWAIYIEGMEEFEYFENLPYAG